MHGQSSVEAVVTATAYLELCLRSVVHPGLVRALLRLLLRHRHEGVAVMDTLIQRIAATPRVSKWEDSSEEVLLTCQERF